MFQILDMGKAHRSSEKKSGVYDLVLEPLNPDWPKMGVFAIYRWGDR